MHRPSIALTLSVALALGAFPPAPALAGGPPQRHGTHVTIGPRVVPRPFVARPFVGPPFFHRFAPFPIVASPLFVYSPPPVFYTTPTVVIAPQPYANTYSYVEPPAPPGSQSMSRVILYPHGRYELYGDGVTTPYQWVWIPNAPPPPPPPPPASAPAPAAPAAPGPPTSQPQLFRWTDDQGVTTWTDQWDKIPVEDRAQALRLEGPPS